MKKLFCLLSLLFTTNLQAETSVWTAQKDGATVYLGGTIHVLRQSDYPLPKEYEKAFQASQLVVFETDINQLSNPQLASELIKNLSYPDQRTINSVVSAETYKKLDKYARQNGLSLNYYRKAKPGMLMMTFLAVELQKMGATAEGIDIHFLKKAIKQNKKTDFLETPLQQIQFLAQMGVGKEDSFYQNMLRDFANTQEQMHEMISVWRSGDSAALDALVNQPMAKDYPDMFQFILLDRNLNWLPKIEAYFKSPAVEFVMVGAAHLVGDKGIIKQLKAKGYRITRL